VHHGNTYKTCCMLLMIAFRRFIAFASRNAVSILNSLPFFYRRPFKSTSLGVLLVKKQLPFFSVENCPF
jgi:hypothetical protein